MLTIARSSLLKPIPEDNVVYDGVGKMVFVTSMPRKKKRSKSRKKSKVALQRPIPAHWMAFLYTLSDENKRDLLHALSVPFDLQRMVSTLRYLLIQEMKVPAAVATAFLDALTEDDLRKYRGSDDDSTISTLSEEKSDDARADSLSTVAKKKLTLTVASILPKKSIRVPHPQQNWSEVAEDALLPHFPLSAHDLLFPLSPLSGNEGIGPPSSTDATTGTNSQAKSSSSTNEAKCNGFFFDNVLLTKVDN